MKISKVAIIAIAAVFLANLAFAQEEEGLIQRLIKRFRQQSSKPAVQQPAVPAKPAVPAAVQPATAEAAKPMIKVSDYAKTLTKDELIKEINSEIQDEDEILDYIPSLKKMKDADGKEYLAYDTGTMKVRLEDLDRDKLESILSRVYNQATLIQTERINSQLESIRQIQNITRQANTVPRVPAAAPTVPQQPPQPPARVPPAPPAQPKR